MFASVTSLEVLMLRGPLLITLALASAPAQSLPSSAFDARVLAAHNAERAALRLPLLAWDPALAASAAVHANYLAATGTFTHSKRRARRGVGENIWQGTRGAFSPEQMVGNWASEKRYFVPGIFPASSRTGNWNHVGHYAQIIWPTTQRIGCSLGRGRNDVLVCHYSPAGNIDGRRVP